MHTLLFNLQKFSTLRTLLGIVAFILTLFFTVIVPPSSPVNQLSQYTHGVGILDAERYYDADKAYAMLTAYGEYGRQLYLTQIAPMDIVIPIIYSLFFAVSLSFVFQRAFSQTNPVQFLGLLPFGVALVDYMENASIVRMLVAYPNRLDSVATLAGYFTALKQMLFFVLVALLLIGAAAWVWQRVRLVVTVK